MSRRRFVQCADCHDGFTLIELLAVMAIILLLAGLLLSVAGNAQYKSSMSRATAEIKQMETAMESYKVDNGAYPRDTPGSGSTDTLNAQTSTDPTANSYIAASKFLFAQLSGITATPGTYTKVYINFLPSQLSTGSVNPTLNTTYIIDPFGFSYGYSTINQYSQDQINSGQTPSTALSSAGYNPTFDLWSTGGYATGGKNYSSTGMATTTYNTLWAKNW